jgi:hypothetical protein
LFNFTDALVEYPLGNFGEASLLLNKEYLTKVALGIHKILHVLYEVQVGKFARKLVNV